MTVGIEIWDCYDEYVITLNGYPVGRTLGKSDAQKIGEWLEGALAELVIILAKKEDMS